MGVRGLETFMEKHSDACFRVNVLDEVRKYRGQHNTAPIIVIDGMSVMRFIYKFRGLSWIYGGQLKEYEECLKEFILAFLNEGAELIFIFDGPFVASKLDTWIRRRLDNLKQIYFMLDDLSRGGRISYHENGNLCILPANLRSLTLFVASKCGCKVFNSIRDADLEIAEYAVQHNCMAILGQDTDFVIFESAKYYWSIKHFNLETMSTICYDRQRLAATLGLSTHQLPLLATLMGNDLISSDELKTTCTCLTLLHLRFGRRTALIAALSVPKARDPSRRRYLPFHQKVSDRGGHYLKHSRVNFSVLFHEVSKFIQINAYGPTTRTHRLKEIALHVFSDASKSAIIEESLLSYDLSAEKNKNVGCPKSSDDHWGNILKKLYELYLVNKIPPSVYNIIVYQRYTVSTCVEDYRLFDLPATQMVLKPLRQKIYGVLLHEKPVDNEIEECVLVKSDYAETGVEELVMCGPNSLDDFVFVEALKPKVHHPGLLALWDSVAHIQQWTLLGDIFSVDVNKIKEFPPHLIIPVLTFKYLQDKIQILSWEWMAAVSSAVLVHYYNTTSLSKIPVSDTIKCTRPFRLFTLISRSYSLTILAFDSIGKPLPREVTVATNYMDGKLFHFKYQQACKHPVIADLCDNIASAIDQCERILNFIRSSSD